MSVVRAGVFHFVSAKFPGGCQYYAACAGCSDLKFQTSRMLTSKLESLLTFWWEVAPKSQRRVGVRPLLLRRDQRTTSPTTSTNSASTPSNENSTTAEINTGYIERPLVLPSTRELEAYPPPQLLDVRSGTETARHLARFGIGERVNQSSGSRLTAPECVSTSSSNSVRTS